MQRKLLAAAVMASLAGSAAAHGYERKNAPEGGTANITELLQKQGEAFEQFKKANDARLADIEKKGHAPADTVEKVEKLNQALTDIGKQLKAAQDQIDAVEKKGNRPGAGKEMSREEAEHKAAFEAWFRKGVEGDLKALEVKALNTGSDPDGGFVVPTEIETMIDRVLVKDVAMRRLARVRVIGSNSYKLPVVTSGANYGWIGETEDSAETTAPKFSELDFVPGKLYAEPWATNDMLEDAVIDIASWLADEVNIGFAEGEGQAFLSGTGIKKPRGLLTYPTVANASYAWGSLGYIASGAAGDWAASNPSDKLIDMVHALKRGYRNNGSWLTNDLTLAGVRKFKEATTNAYIWQPGLQKGVPDTLLGYPVETDDYMPDIAANSLSLAFGDFNRGYLIVDRRGVMLIRDNVTKKGYTKFHTTKRVGGGVRNFEAIKLMKFAAS